MYLNLLQSPAFLLQIPVIGTKLSQSMEKVPAIKYQLVVEQNERISRENENSSGIWLTRNQK
jgi:hypothetical protein